MRNRYIPSVGIFDITHWKGDTSLLTEAQLRIFSALQALGFRVSLWQIVFQGQILGMMRPVDGNGYFEYHVRFYENGTIDAECEVGRHYIDHFFVRRGDASGQILMFLEPRLQESRPLFVARHKEVIQPTHQPRISILQVVLGTTVCTGLLSIAGFLHPLYVSALAALFVTLAISLPRSALWAALILPVRVTLK